MSEINTNHCPICEKLSEDKPKNTCEHRTPLFMGYGFGRVSGWVGIGITYRCPDCSETLWFEEDNECHEDEIESNKIKKQQNEKWGKAVKEGLYD